MSHPSYAQDSPAPAPAAPAPAPAPAPSVEKEAAVVEPVPPVTEPVPPHTHAEEATPPPAPRHRPKAGELMPFVLPWDDASESVMNLSAWSPGPAGRNGFVFMKDGHLWEPSAGEGPTERLQEDPAPAAPRRLRLLGVNLCFDANFPKKEDAPKIAARMAKFGINCVRFHHMDFYPAPRGLLNEDMLTLNAGQLDLLDFFVAELKKQGIYSDLNLHVSRSYPGFPAKWERGDSFLKGVDQFHPEMIHMQKDFARDLLTHVNPYTGARYLDEPAIALVEINNENGLIFQWASRKLDHMPEELASVLNKRWTRWLVGKYPPGDAPQPLGPAAWDVKEQPLGEEMLLRIYSPNTPEESQTWYLEQHEDAEASLTSIGNLKLDATPEENQAEVINPWRRLEVQKPAPEGWHIQLSHAGLKLEADQAYTFEAEVMGSEAVKEFSVTLSQAGGDWEQLATANLAVTPQASRVRITLITSAGEENARLVLGGFGKLPAGSWIQFRDVSLKPGGVKGLDLTQDVLSYRFVKKEEFAKATLTQKKDWIDFLWHTEDDYWREMDHYLRGELGVKSLLIGTQAYVFSNAALQSRFPVIDTHGYWHHPRFPAGKSWSPEEWTVKNEPMSVETSGGEPAKLGVNRVKGLAFVVTEYNHPAPMSYAAEAFPLLAAYAAWQDWDGIFPFAYSHGGPWDRAHIRGFFDIQQDPLKMATLPMAAALFLRGDMVAPETLDIGPVPPSAFRNAMMGGNAVVDATNFGVNRADLMRGKMELEIGEPARDAAPGSEEMPPVGAEPADAQDPAQPQPSANAAPPAYRYHTPAKGKHPLAIISAPRSKGVIGHTQGAEFDLGDGVKVSGVNTRLPEDWAVITLSQLTGSQVTGPGRVLLLAMSDQENTDLQWVDEKTKTSVGTNWGKAPSRVECITARVTLPLPRDSVQVWSLDERGQPLEALPITGGKTSAVIELKPEYGTIWYEVIVL